jgi:hypothetical protein
MPHCGCNPFDHTPMTDRIRLSKGAKRCRRAGIVTRENVAMRRGSFWMHTENGEGDGE